ILVMEDEVAILLPIHVARAQKKFCGHRGCCCACKPVTFLHKPFVITPALWNARARAFKFLWRTRDRAANVTTMCPRMSATRSRKRGNSRGPLPTDQRLR